MYICVCIYMYMIVLGGIKTTFRVKDFYFHRFTVLTILKVILYYYIHSQDICLILFNPDFPDLFD